MPGHTNGVAVSRKTDPRGEVARVIFGRPNPILRNFNGCKACPLCTGRAVDVPVQPRMVHEDL